MNTKLLKKMCVVGASTCLGLTCVVAPAIICTSCSESNPIVVANESNVTTGKTANLVLNLDDVKISEGKTGYVVFEKKADTDIVDFGTGTTTPNAVVKITPKDTTEGSFAKAEVAVNCTKADASADTKITIKATVYEDEDANVPTDLTNGIPTTSKQLASNDVEITFNESKVELTNTLTDGKLDEALPGTEVQLNLKAYNIDTTSIKTLNVSSSNTKLIDSNKEAQVT